MAGTNARAAKKALIDMLASAPDLAGVNVDYAWKAQRWDREYIYGGRVTSVQNYAAMTSGRKPRDETLTVDVHFDVRIPGGDQVDADARVIELHSVMEDLLAGDVTLGGVVPGLRYAGVTGFDMTPAFDDEAIWAEMVSHVLFSSRLF